MGLGWPTVVSQRADDAVQSHRGDEVGCSKREIDTSVAGAAEDVETIYHYAKGAIRRIGEIGFVAGVARQYSTADLSHCWLELARSKETIF